MENATFTCDGINGPVSVTIEDWQVIIREAGKEPVSIHDEDLTAIHFKNHAWSVEGRRYGLVLSFEYRSEGGLLVKELLLACGQPTHNDLLHCLDSRFAVKSFIGPSDKEKRQILEPSFKGSYRLHRLHIMTPLGIILFLLIISTVLSFAVPATLAPEVRRPTPGLETAGQVLMALDALVGSLCLLILTGRLMVLWTSLDGCAWRKIFSRGAWGWDQFEAGAPKFASFNVHTGMFCYYSDQVNVFASNTYLEVPLIGKDGTRQGLKLPLDEAGRLYREFYYRGKASLEDAKKAGAFP